MPRLILIRHAKSAWDDPETEDHDRVLNERGRYAASALGAWLAEKRIVPGQALVSDSARTVETWQRIAAALPGAPEAELVPELYLAWPARMLDVLRARGRADAVAMVGHNPGIGEFAAEMVEAPADHPRFSDYPTGATTVMDLSVARWSDVAFGTAKVADFIVPRDLTD